MCICIYTPYCDSRLVCLLKVVYLMFYFYRYMFNPKNFEAISSYLPNKVSLSTAISVFSPC